MTAATEKILFTCAGCGYKARIPSHYAGRSIHCPQCKSVQAVPAVEEPAAAGAPAPSQEAAPTLVAAPAPVGGRIVFSCTSCAYKGRLSAEYEGKTIRCPGCQTPQVVKGTPVPSPIVASLAADEPVFKGMEGDKVRFICASCGYRARIPSKYAGKPIHCPQCKKVEVVKPEADMEDSTGKTVSISKISSVEVKEPRLAMTNVGVQFACAVCGYESRISPSCVGDAIYCPKCRSPQKVEWSDPAATKPSEPASAALEAKVDEPAPLPGLFADPALSLVPEPRPSIAPTRMATPLPVAAPVPTAPLAPPAVPPAPATALGDITDIQAILGAPEEPKPAPVAAKVSKQGGRRVITAAPRDAAPAADAPEALAQAPGAADEGAQAARASANPAPKRRSVTVPAGSTPAAVPASESEPDTEETAKALPAPRRGAAPAAPVRSAAPGATGSKLPLIVIGAVAALLLVVAIVLFVMMQSLSTKVSDLETAQAKASQDAAKARQDAEDAAKASAAESARQLEEAKAATEAAKAEADAAKAAEEAAKTAVEAAKAAEEAARQELERLKAAAPVALPEAPKPADAAKPAKP